METDNMVRRRIISDLMAQHTDKIADASIDLWEQMATQIILIVGEGGFNSLYARSLFLTRSTFPWLPNGSVPAQANQRFSELKISFEEQPPLQANKANSQLLITFTDILASLIGEHLTIRILRSAWGNDALDRFGKEFKNE
ncbi:hypothetical protein [Methylobacter sp.]|uniref:hypothetical protein n=1 Tax=Methylobacter sp. TaxID=2051955 RepID=UPI0012047106|nr:hypothetical protein [Methylobacter sp.]TAK61885.1 MAG: hypothetical protein EPO18_12255 [Methylobacter sp.]